MTEYKTCWKYSCTSPLPCTQVGLTLSTQVEREHDFETASLKRMSKTSMIPQKHKTLLLAIVQRRLETRNHISSAVSTVHHRSCCLQSVQRLLTLPIFIGRADLILLNSHELLQLIPRFRREVAPKWRFQMRLQIEDGLSSCLSDSPRLVLEIAIERFQKCKCLFYRLTGENVRISWPVIHLGVPELVRSYPVHPVVIAGSDQMQQCALKGWQIGDSLYPIASW